MQIIFISIFILNLDVILSGQNNADAYQHQKVQAIKLGEGIKYPSHPLSETETRAKVGHCHNEQAHKRLVLNIAYAQKPH